MYNEMKKILFDEKRSGLITLENEGGERLKFLQVYATVLDDEVYCILSPAVVVSNIENNTALVFKLLSSCRVRFENDAEISNRVFSRYYSDLNARREKS